MKLPATTMRHSNSLLVPRVAQIERRQGHRGTMPISNTRSSFMSATRSSFISVSAEKVEEVPKEPKVLYKTTRTESIGQYGGK